MLMCEPFFPHDSSLECSKYLRFCRGRNILLNLTDLSTRQDPIRYKLDVLKQGQIGKINLFISIYILYEIIILN